MRKASRGNLSPRSGRSGPAGRWGDAPYQDSPTVPAFARGTALLPGHTGSWAVPESRGRPREVISLSGRDTRLQSPSASPAGVGGERRGYQVCASGHLGLQAANSGVREVPAVENRNPRAGVGLALPCHLPSASPTGWQQEGDALPSPPRPQPQAEEGARRLPEAPCRSRLPSVGISIRARG